MLMSRNHSKTNLTPSSSDSTRAISAHITSSDMVMSELLSRTCEVKFFTTYSCKPQRHFSSAFYPAEFQSLCRFVQTFYISDILTQESFTAFISSNNWLIGVHLHVAFFYFTGLVLISTQSLYFEKYVFCHSTCLMVLIALLLDGHFFRTI